jgi:predicted amidohydrolase YtcJ
VTTSRPSCTDRRDPLLRYPLGSLQAAGAGAAGSSDWPVDKLNPWSQIRTGVDRTGTFSETGEALYAEQAISLNESLLMHTRGAAFQLFQEEQTGVIEVGRPTSSCSTGTCSTSPSRRSAARP